MAPIRKKRRKLEEVDNQCLPSSFDIDLVPINSLGALTKDVLTSWLDIECQFLPEQDYIDKLSSDPLSRTGRELMIQIARNALHTEPEACILSINFFDRYCSRKKEEVEIRATTKRTLAVTLACITLALKIGSSDKRKTRDLLEQQIGAISMAAQQNEGMITDERSVYRAEAMILDTLNWRMMGISVPQFIHGYLSMIQEHYTASHAFLEHVNRVILDLMEGDVKFTSYRPSIIAGAVLLKAAEEQTPLTERILGPSAAAWLRMKLLMNLPFEIYKGVKHCYNEIHLGTLSRSLQYGLHSNEQELLASLPHDFSFPIDSLESLHMEGYPGVETSGFKDSSNEDTRNESFHGAWPQLSVCKHSVPAAGHQTSPIFSFYSSLSGHMSKEQLDKILEDFPELPDERFPSP